MTLLSDAAIRETPSRGLGSSWKLRRLVIAGHVVFDPVALTRPAMSAREVELLAHMLERAQHVLEFGAGGSTTFALKLGVADLTSVESDRAWIDRILLDRAAARARRDGRLKMLHADVGPISALGSPASAASRPLWPSYAARPWASLDAEALDLVLVDGRFRVACILQTILHVTPRTLIAVHDFWTRPHYHGVLQYLEEVHRCESLAVFRVRENLRHDEIAGHLAQAAYVPR